jgi:hypothetical protein
MHPAQASREGPLSIPPYDLRPGDGRSPASPLIATAVAASRLSVGWSVVVIIVFGIT